MIEEKKEEIDFKKGRKLIKKRRKEDKREETDFKKRGRKLIKRE